jgi:sec-independent protein translocase protein TatC
MPLLEHVEEFRRRLLWILATLAAGTALGFGAVVHFRLLEVVLHRFIPYLVDGKLKYLSPADPFMVALRLSFAVGVAVTFPVAFFHLWRFVSPILAAGERRVVLPALCGAVFLFLGGASLAYFGVMPITLQFFKTFEPGSLEQNLTIDKFVGYMMKLLLGFGAAFETPVIMLALGAMGIVSSELLVRYRRHAILVIFVVGAALTPPDVFSQLLMAVPLLLLYELSIWLVRWTERKRAAATAEAGVEPTPNAEA